MVRVQKKQVGLQSHGTARAKLTSVDQDCITTTCDPLSFSSGRSSIANFEILLFDTRYQHGILKG